MTTISPWRNKRRSLIIALPIAFIALCLLAFAPASRASAAAGDGWPPIGPDSGADGNVLVHPTDPSRIFITSNEGLFRSDDGGEHWRTLYIRKGWSDSLWQVVLNPSDPETLYALFRRGFSFPYSYEFFVSHDRGESWLFQFSPPSTDGGANWIGPTLAIAPSAPNTLYLFANHQLFKSDDGGRSWTQLGVSWHEITAISIAPSNAGMVYAATVGSTNLPRRILKSEDGGESWISLDAPDVGWILSMAIHPTDPETLFISGYDGLSVSHDGGRSWANTGLDTWQSSNINISPTDPAIMYATAGGSAFKSEDGGVNWRVIDAAIPDAGRPSTTALAIHPTDPETVFINRSQYYLLADSLGRDSSAKLYKSADGGDSWLLPPQGLLNNAVSDFAFSAGTDALYVTSGPGAFRRDANSQAWTAINNGLGEAPPMAHQIAISPGVPPDEPETLYISTQLASDDTLTIYKSLDEGESWTLAGPTSVDGPSRDMVVAPTSPPSLYLINAVGEIEKSRDGGATWTILEAGPARAGEIAVDPTDPNRLYATDINTPRAGLWRSVNGGQQCQYE